MAARIKKATVPLEEQPPEELRALCSLANVKITFVKGRPARTWRLTSDISDSAVTLQTVEYDAWADACKLLTAGC